MQYCAHLSRWAVDAGEGVRAGDVVGYAGSTGNAGTTPAHLHFWIHARREEGPIDPLPFASGAKGPQRGGDSGAARAKPGHESTGIGG